MDNATLADCDFASPWVDLRVRLSDGIVAVNDLRHAREGSPSDQIRLCWKRDALEDALTAWDRLNDQIADGTLDHAGAWRTFTDRAAALYAVRAVNPGYHQGVSLALSYQRGYGAPIDAPAIANPHLSREDGPR